MMKKMLTWLLALTLLLPGMTRAEECGDPVLCAAIGLTEPAVEDGGLELGNSSVHYPRLTGLGDEALEAAVNALIQEELGVTAYLNRVALLLSDPTGLTVTYDAQIVGDVFTCSMEASGAVVNSRPTHVRTAVNIDLRDGHAISLDELFFTWGGDPVSGDADPSEVLQGVERYLDEQVAPELSAHLSAGSLTPVPEMFALSPYGLTLLYPIEQLSTLQDEAGAVTILWSEIQPLLWLTEDGILERIGARDNLAFPENALEALTGALAGGGIPGIPAAIGQPVQELTDAYGLQIDPDLYEGGRMFLPDDAAFREIWLLSDALTSGWDHSVVQGLRADRLNLLGLQTGVTTRDDYLAALGEPDSTLQVDGDRALNWRIVPGVSDYYAVGDYRLRLHTDESGVLRSVFFTQ